MNEYDSWVSGKLRRYNLEDLINRSFLESCSFGKGVHKNQTIQYKQGNRTVYETIVVLPWVLLDFSYAAILNADIHRNNNVRSDNEFYTLYYLVQSIINNKINSNAHELSVNQPRFWLNYSCFAGEQFRYQRLPNAIDNCLRDAYMLLETKKLIKKSDISIEEIIRAEVGVEVVDLLNCLIYVTEIAYRKKQCSIQSIKASLELSSEKAVMFDKVIDYYSGTVGEIQNSNLNRQFFYTKPFIRLDRAWDNTLCVNHYVNMFTVEHCLYWIVRNYYFIRESQDFTNEFGEIFELYFLDLMRSTIPSSCYEKIKEESTSRADWVIRLCGHTFIVEQKSALLSLLCKQQDNDGTQLEKFCEKILIEAIEQLDITATEKCYHDPIKIVLLYEDFIQTDLLSTVFQLPNCQVENDNRFWLLTIDEMEKLLFLYGHNQDLFEKVVNDKLALDEQSGDSNSIELLLEQEGIEQNDYIRSEKFREILRTV